MKRQEREENVRYNLESMKKKISKISWFLIYVES